MGNLHHPRFGNKPHNPYGKEPFKYLPHVPGDGGHDPAREIGTSNWVFSYADMMTSMVVFLILLLSFSRIDYDTLAAMSQEMNGQTVPTDAADKGEPALQKPATPLSQVESKLESLAHIEGVEFQKVGSGAYLTIKDSVLFESGRSRISASARQSLLPVFQALRDLPGDYHFIVEGHTDDNPIHTSEFASNWELSAARALAVMLMMNDLHFDAPRLSFQAFGEFQPLAPNRDASGNPIPENQSRNRRAVVKIRQSGATENTPTAAPMPPLATGE